MRSERGRIAQRAILPRLRASRFRVDRPGLRLLACLAAVVALAACQGREPPPASQDQEPPSVSAGQAAPPASAGQETPPARPELELRLELDMPPPGDDRPLGLRLIVENPSQRAVTLNFPTACQDNFIVRLGDEALWALADERMCAQMLTEHTLAPGDTVTYDATWNFQRSDGASLPAGEYTVVGELLTRPPRSTEAQTITVQ